MLQDVLEQIAHRHSDDSATNSLSMIPASAWRGLLAHQIGLQAVAAKNLF